MKKIINALIASYFDADGNVKELWFVTSDHTKAFVTENGANAYSASQGKATNLPATVLYVTKADVDQWHADGEPTEEEIVAANQLAADTAAGASAEVIAADKTKVATAKSARKKK